LWTGRLGKKTGKSSGGRAEPRPPYIGDKRTRRRGDKGKKAGKTVVVERSRDHHKQDKQTRRRGDDIADCGFWISNFGLRIEDEETSKMGQGDKETGRQGEKSRKNSGGRAVPIAIGTRPPYIGDKEIV